MLHQLAVALIALAGVAYCTVAVLRLRSLRAPTPLARPWLVWAGVAAHSAAVVVSLVDGGHLGFTFSVLGVWAGVGSLLFLRGFLAAPNRALLILPLGAMALLLAMAGLARGDGQARVEASAVVWVHIVFMTACLAAHLLAGASAALYLMAVRQLKRADGAVFTLPTLSKLDHLFERSLVVATACLLGGLATGGVAMHLSRDFALSHPAAVLSLANMALLVVGFTLRLAGHLGRRGLAVTALAAMALSALGALSLIVLRHG